MPLVEGVDGLQAACRGRGRAPCCLSRAWNCSTLPLEGMEVFHAARGGRGSDAAGGALSSSKQWSLNQLKAAQSSLKQFEVA